MKYLACSNKIMEIVEPAQSIAFLNSFWQITIYLTEWSAVYVWDWMNGAP